MLSRKAITAAATALLSCGTFHEARAEFQPGEFITYSQESWGATPSPGNAAQLLIDRFHAVYPGGAMEVGPSGSAGFSILFTSAPAVLNYLPSSGGPGPLNADLIDPTSTSSGYFGGTVSAFQLNVDFNDAGELAGISNTLFGDLVIAETVYPHFNGLTVRQFLAEANRFLGGGVNPNSFEDLALITADVTRAFEGGTPDQFAQDHLRFPGDLNGDRKVDAADYVVWRKTDGTLAGFNEWRANFGWTSSAGSGGISSVPEPSTLLALPMCGLALFLRRRKIPTRRRLC